MSYLHVRLLVVSHGRPGWVAVLTPLSVDGMIVAASMTLLADSRSSDTGGVLVGLLAAGSVASLAANVAVAEPSAVGRVVAAWPSFALIAAYELLMRQVRRSSAESPGRPGRSSDPGTGRGCPQHRVWLGPGSSAAGVAVGAGSPGG